MFQRKVEYRMRSDIGSLVTQSKTDSDFLSIALMTDDRRPMIYYKEQLLLRLSHEYIYASPGYLFIV